MTIQTDLEAFGIAQVVVVLKASNTELSVANSKEHFSTVIKNFVQTDENRDIAIATAASMQHLKTKASRIVSASAPDYHVFPNLGLMLGTIDRKGMAGLNASNKVLHVLAAPEFSLIRPVASRVVTQPLVGPTWGLKKMRVPELWEGGIKGKGVIVGHLDTGVDGKHPALKNAIHAFAQFDDVGRIVPGAKATDSDEHGTHTAGTIAGRATPKGSFGVAPECKLASAMVIESGNIVARILGGMDWVIGQKAKVVSMSLGIRGFNPAFLSLVQILRDKGVLPVIAVGNEGPGTSRSPGNYSNSLSVGASNGADRVANFSSSQKFDRVEDPIVPDIVAPGVAVFSSLPDNQFGEMNGSSMATPHIAGLAALLWQAKPSATVDEIEAAIFASCTRPATMAAARANRGLPDAVLAFEHLTSTPLSSLLRAKKKTVKKTTKPNGKRLVAIHKKSQKVKDTSQKH